MIRVMIVDESAYLRIGMKSVLENEDDFEVVGEFATVADSIAGLAELKPQVVLLSLTVPDGGGFKGCLQILDAAPTTRVVTMTSALTDTNILGAMKVGAAGILPKDGSSCDLVRTVRANGCGELLLIRPVAECDLRYLNYNRGVVKLGCLTEREKDVVALISEGLGNREIAARLSLSPHTVRNHISRVFGKLDISSRAELAVYSALVAVVDDDAERPAADEA